MADIGMRLQMQRLLQGAAHRRCIVLVVHTPAMLSRISLYQALDDHIGRWGRRRGDVGAFIDLSNHPALPAQTIVGSEVRTWSDLADGLPASLDRAGILIVLGLEQMLAATPHRLAAFLRARARRQVVVVLTPLAERVRSLALRGVPVHLDASLVRQSDVALIAKAVAGTAIAAAKQSSHRSLTAASRRRS
jgi:hypothetical protein